MKIGLCVIDVPQTLGGGFVFRDTLAQAALELKGRHSIELVKAAAPGPELKNFDWASRKAAGRDALARLGMADLWRLGVQSLSNPRRIKREIRTRLNAFIQSCVDEEMRRAIEEMRHAIKDYVDWALEHRLTWPNPDKFRVFGPEFDAQRYDMLWFNNIEPIHVGVPYILNVFDLQHRFQPWFPEVSTNGQYRLREASYAEATRRAAFVIVGSDEIGEQVRDFYGVPKDRIRTIPYPVSRNALEASQRDDGTIGEAALRKKYSVEGPYLFYPAQFWPHKNHVNLLRALKILRDRDGPKFKMVFTGSDHGNAAFIKQTASELGLADQVVFAGFVPYEDVLAFHRFAFALTFVSFFGPENQPPLEAMALGCPVVLSNIPGAEALFGDAPLLVNHRDAASIADGIQSLVKDPAQRSARAEKGRLIAQRNSVGNYLERVQELFDEFEAVRRTWP